VRASRVALQSEWTESFRQDYFYCFAAFDCAVPNAPEMRLRRVMAPSKRLDLGTFFETSKGK
jgi:hypothetical protein